MAGYSNIYLNQGETFTSQLTLTDSNGNAYNLTGFNIASSAKRSYYSANNTINFVVSVIDANNGIIQLSANSATTANVQTIGQNLVYDFLIKDSSNKVTRVLEGLVYVSPSVTAFS
jgi:hypothetical protein